MVSSGKAQGLPKYVVLVPTNVWLGLQSPLLKRLTRKSSCLWEVLSFLQSRWFFWTAWKPFFWNILEKRPVSKHRWSNHKCFVQLSGQSFPNFSPLLTSYCHPFSPRLSHSPLEITNAWAQTWRGRRNRAKVNSAPALQQLLKNSVYPGHKPCCSAVFCPPPHTHTHWFPCTWVLPSHFCFVFFF